MPGDQAQGGVHFINFRLTVNPLSPNSDQHQISPHHISALKHIQVIRIQELITEDKLS